MTQQASGPTTRDERVAEAVRAWRRELADVGGRNSLLWHRDLDNGTLDVTVAHPSGVASLLSSNPTRLTQLVRERVSLAEAAERCETIRAKVAHVEAERGWRVGYLAVGMASWRIPGAKLPPRAPVLLRVARIEPLDASNADYQIQISDDVLVNPVLEFYLRSELGIWLDTLAMSEMAVAGPAFDPRPVYDALERACASLEEFRISPQLVLGCFPLAKLALVADVASNSAAFQASDIVAALAGDPASRRELSGLPASVDDLGELDPSSELLVLDADASQSAALVDASQRSVVVDAAPGTGRTQTIANAVAAEIANGGLVLATAEKSAALASLERRLAHVGLGRWLLPVHEDGAGGHELAERLRSALDALDVDQADQASDAGEDVIDVRGELADVIQALRAHESALLDPRQPWGVSVAESRNRLVELAKGPDAPRSRVRLDARTLAVITPQRLETLAAILRGAAEAGGWEDNRAPDPWFGAALPTAEDAERAVEITNRLADTGIMDARAVLERVAASVGMESGGSITQWGERLALLAGVTETLDSFRPEVYDASLADLVAATGRRDDADTGGTLARARLRRQARSLLRPGHPPADLHQALANAMSQRDAWQLWCGRGARPMPAVDLPVAQRAYDGLRRDLEWLADVLRETEAGADLLTVSLDEVLNRVLLLVQRLERARAIPAAHAALTTAREAGLVAVVKDLSERGIPASAVSRELQFVWHTSMLDQLERTDAELLDAGGEHWRALLRTFRGLDHAHLQANAVRIHVSLEQAARRALRDWPDEAAALRSLLAGGGPLLLREVYAVAPHVVPRLAPVWLASPLVVGFAVPVEARPDLVVVDEASRVPVSHALGALVRAGRVLVVGDSRGAGPKGFSVVPGTTEEGAAERQSLLDAAGEFLPRHRLTWHYPARDERLVRSSLVARYPEVRMFASPLRTPPVRHVQEDDVVAAAVEQVVGEIRRAADLTMMVVVEHPDLVRTVRARLATRLGELPGSLRPQDSAGPEPLVVSSLDDSPGDVRDTVVLVVGDEQGGECDLLGGTEADRWAAVALTRARRTLVCVTATGAALPALVAETLADAQQDRAGGEGEPQVMLADLARRLRVEGLAVHEHVGVGEDVVPLAVEDPARPGRMLLALEPETSTESMSVREKYRLRFEQLVRLGWVPMPVSTTDIFRDPAREVSRIQAALRAASDQAASR